MNILEPWHRVTSEEQLEHLVRGGWEEFTLRPNGAWMAIWMNEDLFNRQLACLCTTNFKNRMPPNWTMFREIMIAVRLHQVCVPGPLSSHELAFLAVGENKSKKQSEPFKDPMPWESPGLY